MKAVLFDLDGTLLDTEKWYQEGWRLAAEELGYPLSASQRLEFRSLGKPFNRLKLKEMLGEAADYARLRERRISIMKPWFEEREIPVKEGAEEILSYLSENGYMTAVVTATGREKAEHLLDVTGLLPYFERVICAPMVERGKPAPDVYLYACDELGVLPSDAIAVEDAPNGVRSAADAGCRVVMIPDLTEPDEETRKLLWKKISCLHDLKEVL